MLLDWFGDAAFAPVSFAERRDFCGGVKAEVCADCLTGVVTVLAGSSIRKEDRAPSLQEELCEEEDEERLIDSGDSNDGKGRIVIGRSCENPPLMWLLSNVVVLLKGDTAGVAHGRRPRRRGESGCGAMEDRSMDGFFKERFFMALDRSKSGLLPAGLLLVRLDIVVVIRKECAFVLSRFSSGGRSVSWMSFNSSTAIKVFLMLRLN